MYEVIEDFRGSPDGIQVIEFKKGEPFDWDGDLLEVAKKQKWVKKASQSNKPSDAEKEAAKLAKQIAEAKDNVAKAETALAEAADDKKYEAQKALDAAKEALAVLEKK